VTDLPYMISRPQNRLDPSVLDREELDRLAATFSRPGHVALIDSTGHRTELPEPLYAHLMSIVHILKEGSAVVMMPENETFTTQAAANYLGVSRQFLVNLLEQGKLNFHRVGAHRRIYFRDLLDFQEKRDAERTRILDELREQVDGAGLYFPEAQNEHRPEGNEG